MGVGAQRSGTSWWHGLIESHPEVHALGWPFKELHYFDRFEVEAFTDHDVRRYHAQFRRPTGRQCGEWTPRYMLDDWVPSLLHRAAPDAKLLVMLRDPVDRLASGLSHALTRGVSRDEAFSDARRRGFYWEQLSRLHEFFPRERVLVLQFERCVRDRDAMLDRTYSFLGLPSWRPPQSGERVNRGAQTPSIVTDSERARLRDDYSSDVSRLLEEYPDIDLDLWPQMRLAT